MDISIKNMVCNRCIMVVSQIFEEAKITTDNIKLGKVVTSDEVSPYELKQLNNNLKSMGFEIIDDSKSRLIEAIKNITIDYVYYHSEENSMNFSDYLTGKLNLVYPYLSSLFSSVEGTTIEKYMINLKIERVKELLVYDEKTLSEIAHEMGYSSVAHLSGQFKKITGFTPTYFKNLRDQNRKSIHEL
ncbi:MAG: AraC family transcriptional regulator [Dysgonamonadaceae bacterium]